jgi:hypothetical protein
MEKTLTVYLIVFNEEILLPFTIAFYRKRFPGCAITIFDNMSTDKTPEIAKNLGCSIVDFWTGDQLSDQSYLDIKNHCWKTAETDWVIVADCDELLDIWPVDLQTDATILRSHLVVMVNPADNLQLEWMNYGYRWTSFPGKFLCFNRNAIREINYEYGCHSARPIGNIRFSDKIYDMLHYKYINLKYLLERYKLYRSRLSQHNKRMKLGIQYSLSSWKLKRQYRWYLKRSTKIL